MHLDDLSERRAVEDMYGHIKHGANMGCLLLVVALVLVQVVSVCM